MRQAALLVVVACVLAVPVAGAVGAPGPQSSAAVQDDPRPAAEGVDITIQLQSDGAARWNISAKYALEDANDTDAFEQLRTDFEAYETDTEFSVDVFRAVVPAVSERVGRSMEIRNAGRTSRVVDRGNNSTGVLSVQFTWTGFSRVDNETLVVDSFSGTWFGDLEAGQTLTIRPPSGYDTDRVEPGPDTITNGAYRWTGPQAFAPGEPAVAFTEAPNGPVGVSMLALVAVGALALVLGAIAVWMYFRGTGDVDWLGRGGGESAGEAAGGAPGGESAAGGADAETASGSSSGPAGGAGAATGTDGEDEAVDPELLSDEERVERLLRDHGGRMKQSKIVEETQWSTAKVSQLLSSMAEDGRVEKLRIGRENLISLPGEGIDEE